MRTPLTFLQNKAEDERRAGNDDLARDFDKCADELVSLRLTIDGQQTEILRAGDEIKRLRAALDAVGSMFYVGACGAVLLKPDFGNFDVLDAANAALAAH